MLRPASVAVSADLIRPPVLTHGLLEALDGVRHGFFTREGGVSQGIYESLNCGVGSRDDRGLVFKNRARAAGALGVGASRLATPHQVHGTDVAIVEEAWRPGEGPKADGVVTKKRGIALGVGTADCGPILFADGTARVIGAAHAGWKGALAGIVEATVAAMEKLGARRDRMVAVLGPTISQRNYEVGTDLVDKFRAADAASERYFIASPRPGHAQFDLPGYIVGRLVRAGLAADDMRLCTYADEQRFFSYRRATHRGEPDYGRMLSAIVLVE
ncbi:MAG TPA: peptidoglycan editing factor PgeF [Bauldia sp.]|nr:peptidoglycan editing factor PgeF [Bauldia sp.]